MFVELHLIQNFAPSDLNRDDTNNPKDCEFGGVRRARISSQCLKRAMRNAAIFAKTTQVAPGLRTKRIIQQLRDRLPQEIQNGDVTDAILTAFVESLVSKLDKDGQRTAVLLYLSQTELDRMAQSLVDNWQTLADEGQRGGTITQLTKTLIKEFKGRTSAPDIALFGRMLAEKPELSLDAASQVAHALSTHRVTMEMDFYTAVDDLQSDDTAGAGMMGFTGYDSACFYRYARLDWDQLISNLDGDYELARRTVEAFLRASIEAIPSGKQNTFAAYNPPSLTLAVVRTGGMAWSLANAFERPIRPNLDSGYVTPSVKALDDYWQRLYDVYGADSVADYSVLALENELPLTALAGNQVANMQAFVQRVTSALATAGNNMKGATT